MRPSRLLAVLFVGLLGTGAGATLVASPTFDQLVDRADLVFEGTVVDVRSEWRETRAGRQIMSAVTYRVLRGLKGDPSPQVVLEMFGGTVGKDTMRIAGMPEFSPGDHDVLFVRQGDAKGLPLVGLMHGRLRVTHTTAGRDIVTTYDNRAIDGLASIGAAPRARAEIGAGLTLDELVVGITARVRSGGTQGARSGAQR